MPERSCDSRLSWRRLHHDERGANQFVVLSACFILILLTPIFVDFASLHFSRRVTQTASDAAALAAAVEYAQFWNLSRINHCGPCVAVGTEAYAETMQYIGSVLTPMANNTGIGYPFALQYAALHKALVMDYRHHWPSHVFTKVYYKQGIPIYPLAIYVKAERPASLSYQQWYTGLFLTPAKATAEVYLDQVPVAYSVACGKYTAYHCATYQWKVRLIRTVD